MLQAVLMTRFKELARIQAAIKHRNESELRWPAGYCQISCGLPHERITRSTGERHRTRGYACFHRLMTLCV